MGPIVLQPIRATSATLAETMRGCFLRAGLSKAVGSSEFVLGSPKTWLGTAYHEVLEKIGKVNPHQEALDVAIDRLWYEAISRQQQRANGHSLDSRFGSPVTWPGYYVARASVTLRAQELAVGGVPSSLSLPMQGSGVGHGSSIREQVFTACGGKLLGRPDVIRDNEVVDYKSGAVVEYDEVTQADVIKAAYVRQLRIYGVLVKETLGRWPQRGVLLPVAGAGIEIPLEPSECEREAADAVALLDTYNGKVQTGVGPEELASPSPQGCRWCPYKVLCQPFWQAVSPEWSGRLDGAAVDGVLAATPTEIHAGVARALSIDVKGGSEPPQRAQIAPLNPDVHPTVTTLVAGDRVRIVGLRARPDGMLIPGARTVIVRVVDLPLLVCTESKTP